jgi:hypothetical protein
VIRVEICKETVLIYHEDGSVTAANPATGKVVNVSGIAAEYVAYVRAGESQ